MGLLPAVLGSFGFAPFTPFAAGYLLRPRDAAATALFAAVLSLVLAGLGTGSLAGWDAFTFGGAALGVAVQSHVATMLITPSTWIVAASWVGAAAASSALCGTGNRILCVLGMVLAGTLEIAGLVLGSLADSAGATALANPLALVPTIAALVLSVTLACAVVPQRSIEEE